MRYCLLITPLSHAAFFNEAIDIAHCEVAAITGQRPRLREVGTLKFLELDYEGPVESLTRLATIDGVFESREDDLRPT